MAVHNRPGTAAMRKHNRVEAACMQCTGLWPRGLPYDLSSLNHVCQGVRRKDEARWKPYGPLDAHGYLWQVIRETPTPFPSRRPACPARTLSFPTPGADSCGQAAASDACEQAAHARKDGKRMG